ncbi:hypothetical protein PM082_022296 [Marasmius tenuissimus]|nr:hypothetical protein PM082_022240 [Marasmius tenuissimus]KAJ8074718.1 hypothetical protein PM082_022296 [Marasmius tenuissimus]
MQEEDGSEDSTQQATNSRQAEIEKLQERIRELEAEIASPLGVSVDEIERARERARASAGPSKKKKLAAPVNGYKANPLLAPVSERVSEAVRLNKYVPLSVIIAQSKHFSLRMEEDEMIITRNGVWKTRSLDRSGEMSLPFQEHQNAARALVKVTRQHHGDLRADYLESHFSIVSGLAQTHGLRIAYSYDIQQRELAAGDPRHDLSTLDTLALTLIATAEVKNHQQFGSSTPKRRYDDNDTIDIPPSPTKRSRSLCYRCGGSAHVMVDCTALSTRAGVPCFKLQQRNGRNTLVEESGQQLCFRWSQHSECHFGENCTSVHTCSICHVDDHGAADCDDL